MLNNPAHLRKTDIEKPFLKSNGKQCLDCRAITDIEKHVRANICNERMKFKVRKNYHSFTLEIINYIALKAHLPQGENNVFLCFNGK